MMTVSLCVNKSKYLIRCVFLFDMIFFKASGSSVSLQILKMKKVNSNLVSIVTMNIVLYNKPDHL